MRACEQEAGGGGGRDTSCFSPYYRANDARCAGAMDTFYYDTLKSYNTLSYENLHKFLAKLLHDWYPIFRPAGAREEDKYPADWDIRSVVSAGIITPAAAAGAAFRVKYNEAAPATATATAAADVANPPAPPPGGG